MTSKAKKSFVITNERGLHTRPSGRELVKCASRCQIADQQSHLPKSHHQRQVAARGFDAAAARGF